MQKNVTPGRRKGSPNYPPEFKQQLVAASCEPGISISKLALENGINANLLFKWRQQWREGKLHSAGIAVATYILSPGWVCTAACHFW
ncbi:transposase [Escherichia coli]|uniref:transposase n=1 Tax=Escherichia coli TaxID=562 RepID=UPI0039B6D8DA